MKVVDLIQVFPASLLWRAWSLVLCFTFLGTETVEAAHSSTVVYAGKKFRLPIPAGYCIIPRDNPHGRPYHEIQEQLSAGARFVALIFADCTEWDKRQHDPSYRIQRIGNYSFINVEKREYLFPPYRTRAEYLRNLINEQITNDPATGKDWERSTNEKLRKLATETEIPTELSSLNVGIVHANKDAVFYGITASVIYPNERVRVVGIGGVTLINRAAIAISLSKDYSREECVLKLLDAQKLNIVELIAAND